MNATPALLVTELGHVFRGLAAGKEGFALGHLALDTSVASYERALSNPDHAGAIVLCTNPHIGNVGVRSGKETGSFVARGLVVRELSRVTSNWAATGSFKDALKYENIVGITQVDTRQLAQLHAKNPALKVGIFSGEALPAPIADLSSSTPIANSIIAQLVQQVQEVGQ